MSTCCQDEAAELATLRRRQAGVLRWALVLNGAMFVLEFGAGVWSHSTALLSDSLDMLSDASVYGFSLYVLHRAAAWRAGAALVKGLMMAGLGLGVLVEAVLRLRAGVVPDASTMVGFAVLAFVVNAACFALLYRHRGDDLNLRSTWLCTRNDLVANVAVVVAAAFVARTGSLWPDLLAGVAMAALFLRTAATVVRESVDELRRGWRLEPDRRSPSRVR